MKPSAKIYFEKRQNPPQSLDFVLIWYNFIETSNLMCQLNPRNRMKMHRMVFNFNTIFYLLLPLDPCFKVRPQVQLYSL